jgi:pimeloyl-ACP methyl ester carboxylesterase
MKNYRYFLLFAILTISCQSTQNEVIDSSTVEIVREGVLIHHSQCGSGDLSIVFVHGWCIDETYWKDQVTALCGNYNIITMDLPGHGKSGSNREHWTVENYGNDVVAVIDQLKLDRVVLVGHSMGGDIVLEAALKRPDKVIALVGIDNFKDVGVEYSQQDEEEMEGFMQMLKNDFADIAPQYAEGYLFHSSTDSLVAARVMKDFRQSDPEVAVSSLSSLFQYAKDEKENLSKLRQKIYLINSDATPTNIEGLEATKVRYNVDYIHATGHYPMIEKPAEFNKILKSVIRKIEDEDDII